MASHHHDSESNKPSGDGHCAYMADNPFAVVILIKPAEPMFLRVFARHSLKSVTEWSALSILNMVKEIVQGSHR